MGRGIISHMVKYSHIDDAERNFHTLSSQLRSLKSELSDVKGLALPWLNQISSGQRMVDFWSDNIFTDLSVRSKVSENADKIRELFKNIKDVEKSLKSKLIHLDTEIERNRNNEEEL
jgi:hypothetical protein